MSRRGAGMGLLVGLALSACGTTVTYVPTNSPPNPMAPKASPAEVEVFTTTAPTRPYVEVGILRARQASGYSTHGTKLILAELRRRAAAVGCDGITILGSADVVKGSVSTVGETVTGSVDTLEGYQANCLVFTAPASQAMVQPAALAAAVPGNEPEPASAPVAPRDKAAMAKADEARTLLSQGHHDEAEALTLGTLEACADKCTGSVKARLWAIAGIARCRRDERDGAKQAFQSALAEDKSVTLDDTVADDKARALFYETRAAR